LQLEAEGRQGFGANLSRLTARQDHIFSPGQGLEASAEHFRMRSVCSARFGFGIGSRAIDPNRSEPDSRLREVQVNRPYKFGIIPVMEEEMMLIGETGDA